MNVEVKMIDEKDDERVIIECVEVTPIVSSIKAFVLTRGSMLIGKEDDRLYKFRLSDVFYFEAVDEKVFAYTNEHTYELSVRLYELEDAYQDKHFVRCSKSFIINLMKLEYISPALNGRFYANMKNGEKIIITRHYVPAIKDAVFGGDVK